MALASKQFQGTPQRRRTKLERVDSIDPQALFIWETVDRRIVVGRALARAVIVLITGGSAAGTAHYWMPALCKWLGLP